MLAAKADLTKLRWPALASPKLDGVRAIVINGVVMSRSLKPIPNLHVQKLFGKRNSLDGELIVGAPTSKTCYNETVSGVMRVEGTPPVHFHVFDSIAKPEARYGERRPMVEGLNNYWEVPQLTVNNLDDVLELEDRWLAAGYEGLILRDPNAPYKFGRSTVKEGYLLKLKRFIDDEFEVIGFEERQHNGNEATKNELGRTKRSSHQENKTGRGDLGALVLKHPCGSFNCGTGFSDEQRYEIWDNKAKYLGRLAKIKHFEIGAKIAPRHPVFLGFRNDIDT